MLPGRRTSRGSRRPPTCAPARSTAYRPAGTSAHSLHAPARHRGGRVPRPGGRRSARGPRCWSTPTTSRRRSGWGSRSPGRSWARSGSTPATSALLAQQVRAQLDELGAPDTRIIVTSDLDEFAIAGLASAPVDGYGVGTQLVTGSGHPTCGFVYKLVAREDDAGELVGVAKKSKDKISSAAGSTRCAASPPTGWPRPRWSASAQPAENDGDDRALLVPLVQQRRGGRPRAAARRRASGTCARGRAAADGAPAVAGRARDRDRVRGLRASLPSHEAGTDRGRRPERLLRGRLAARRRRRPGRQRHRRAAAPLDEAGPQGSGVRRGGGHPGPPHRPRRPLSRRARTSSTPGRCTAWSAPTARRSTPTSTPSRSTRSSSRASTPPRTPVSRAGRRRHPAGRLAARHEVDRVDVCGIATDHCVRATALDAVENGFTTRLLLDLCAGVAPETTERALAEMRDAGVEVA